MTKIILALFALACILMMLGYELNAPKLALTGIALWSIILIVIWNVSSKYLRRNR